MAEHEETRREITQSRLFTARALGVAAASPARATAVKRRKRKSFVSSVITGLKDLPKLITGPGPGEPAVPFAGIGAIAPRGQITAIARQQFARVPAVAKFGGVAAGGAAIAQALEIGTGRSPARIIHDVGRATFGGGQPRMAGRQQGGLAVGQELPPSHIVVRTWQTFPGGPVFARLADGHIAVQKKDGTIKHFRPYRPVVIPRKWNARSMSRVATALKRQRKTATKILKITGGVPTRTVRVGAKAHRSVDV